MKINASSTCFSAVDTEDVEMVQQQLQDVFFLKASIPGLFENYYLLLLLLFIIVISRRFEKYFGKAKQNLPGLCIILVVRKSQNMDP